MTSQAAQLAQTAKRMAPVIGAAATGAKNAVLHEFARRLRESVPALSEANRQDLAAAEAAALAAPLVERLLFGEKQIHAAADAVMQIAAQADPVGAIDDMRVMPSGISVGKMRVALGVILIIYESRPNVTADAAALAIKSGNAALLRGGREALHTNTAIAACLSAALESHGLAQAAQVITDPAHELLGALLTRAQEIDLVIPRGGPALIKRVTEEARMPALYHQDGNCHIYIDADADIAAAVKIVENAKTRRYGVCNAAESLLVHADIAEAALPPVCRALAAHQVELRVCPQTQAILAAAGISAAPAQEDDWGREYLAPVISIKCAPSLEDAIAHINRYGSAHTDAIVSDNLRSCEKFLRGVDSSSVMVNASTAFADGGEYGLGAETGISTGKLHARGPVGLTGLTTQKYIVLGGGHCRP